MKKLSFEFKYFVQTSVDVAWDVFSHTDKLNQSMGLPPVKYSKAKEKSAIPILEAQTKSMGMTLNWSEIPFEWVRENYFSDVRRFHNGPMKEIHMKLLLEPKENKTSVRVCVDVAPKNWFYWLLLKSILGKKINRDFKRVVAHLNEYAKKNQGSLLPQPKEFPIKESIYKQRVKAVLDEYPEYQSLSELLFKFIKHGFDNEVLGMRPFELADNWGEDRRAVLQFLLCCARVGVLDLKWAVMCPTCKVPTTQHTTLKQLEQDLHCEGCQIKYDTEFDRSVEVRFDVNQAIRAAKADVYCVGNPGSKGKIFAQFILQPNEQRSLDLTLPATRWKAILFGKGETEFSVSEELEDKDLQLKVGDEGVTVSKSIIGSSIQLSLNNQLDRECLIQIEDDRWRDQAATAAFVTSLTRFRDLFSSEVLSPGEEIAVRNLSVMFTDLKGSTAFYQETGDAKAYHLVRSHFSFINEVLEKYNGVLVKTIGDAVFAVFFTTVEALQAAIEIQKGLPAFNENNQSQFEIKMGVHTGPLIAVNANSRIDYFGSTTNIGSRLEKESQGGDVVVTEQVMQDPDIQEWLKDQPLKQETQSTQLRGIQTPLSLTRLIP